MKIYTRKGDDGTTGLIGGVRVQKHDLRIESYGTVDQLNSLVGLIRDQEIAAIHRETLLEIQDRLFTIGSHLASDPEKSRMQLPELDEKDILFLEDQIDRMDSELEPMRSFVLPGGNTVVSYIHVARCVCRRAERKTVHLAELSEIDPLILRYLNRLSDFFFTLSRKIAKEMNAEEIPWKPKTS